MLVREKHLLRSQKKRKRNVKSTRNHDDRVSPEEKGTVLLKKTSGGMVELSYKIELHCE